MKTKNSKEKKVYSEVKIQVSNEIRKAAFSGLNRAIIDSHVDLLEENMLKKGYREEELLQVYKAELAKEKGITVFFDINGNRIPDEELVNYVFVGEGQHRAKAVSRANDQLKEEGKEEINIPSVHVKLRDGEDLIKWMTEKNSLKKEWSKGNFIIIAKNVHPNEEILQRYCELMFPENSKNKYSLSTLGLIFCNGKNLTKKDILLLCAGATEKGLTNKRPIIPETQNIELGNQFIETCLDCGFKHIDIRKRYLATEFKIIRDSKDPETALKVFKSITKEDIDSMRNSRGNLDEQKVIIYFKGSKKRLLKGKDDAEAEQSN